MSRRVLRGFDPDAFRQARLAYKRKGISPQDLGRLADVGESTIWSWENGTRAPNIDKLMAAIAVLGVPVSRVVRISPGKLMLADLRNLAGLTQPELAKRAGMTTTSLSKLERAETHLTEAKAKALAPLLGVSPDEVAAAWQRAKERPPGTPA